MKHVQGHRADGMLKEVMPNLIHHPALVPEKKTFEYFPSEVYGQPNSKIYSIYIFSSPCKA